MPVHGPALKYLDKSRRFLVFLFRRFRDDQCLAAAGGLSYVTLISLVPLLAVLFSLVSAFPAFTAAVDQMQEFIFHSFVPAAGETVQVYLDEFVEQASRLTGVGILFLVVTALVLMDSIDSALNRIWRVGRRRSAVLKFAVYWAVLSLGPILLAASLLMTSNLAALPMFVDMGAGEGGAGVIRVLPFVATALALALLYIIVPNCRVPLASGVIGAVVAASLLEFAKYGFTVYVARVPAYATIYGALAVIPLFLLWIYISWVIVLFGTELAYCLTVFKADRFRPVSDRTVTELIAAFRLIGHLWRAQADGEALSVRALGRQEASLRLETLTMLLQRMEADKIVYRDENGAYGLARDLDQLSLRDLYRIFPAPVDGFDGVWTDADEWNHALFEALRDGQRSIDTAFDVPLKQLYQPPPAGGG